MALASCQLERHVVDDAHHTGYHAALTEMHSSSITYPKWIGRKFDTNGNVRPFAGNTVLSHIDKESQFFSILSEIHQILSQSQYASSFALLPPSSYHITLMEGVCDPVREASRWPADLPLTADLAECNSWFLTKLSSTRLSLGGSPVRMRIDGWRPLQNGISLRLVPARALDMERLTVFRDALTHTLQLRHPGHEKYEFHISITYSLRFYNETESLEISRILDELSAKLPEYIDIGPPELCTFNNMFSFEHLYFLGS